ncbi:ESPR-type extended signal peptide-containing protein [Lysobacter soli]|uniref:ESPR domain-containing protein n=1 Tax=Lysobacter soli TaxID=453783 RepID=UPI0037CAAB24
MNKIYRVVWSAELGQWVVASEVAKGRKKVSSSRMATAATVGMVGAFTLLASGTASAEAYQGGGLALCNASSGGKTYGSSGQGGVFCGNNQERFMLSTSDWNSNGTGNAAKVSSSGGMVGYENGNVTLWSTGLTIQAPTSLSNNRITDLGAGVYGTDAVNVNQLRAVEAKIGTGSSNDASAVHYNTGTNSAKVMRAPRRTKATSPTSTSARRRPRATSPRSTSVRRRPKAT